MKRRRLVRQDLETVKTLKHSPQNQNSLLVKRQNDNTSPGDWPRKISPHHVVYRQLPLLKEDKRCLVCQTCVIMGRGTYAATDKKRNCTCSRCMYICPAKHEPYTRKTSVSDHVGHKPDSSCYGGKLDPALFFFFFRIVKHRL